MFFLQQFFCCIFFFFLYFSLGCYPASTDDKLLQASTVSLPPPSLPKVKVCLRGRSNERNNGWRFARHGGLATEVAGFLRKYRWHIYMLGTKLFPVPGINKSYVDEKCRRETLKKLLTENDDHEPEQTGISNNRDTIAIE